MARVVYRNVSVNCEEVPDEGTAVPRPATSRTPEDALSSDCPAHLISYAFVILRKGGGKPRPAILFSMLALQKTILVSCITAFLAGCAQATILSLFRQSKVRQSSKAARSLITRVSSDSSRSDSYQAAKRPIRHHRGIWPRSSSQRFTIIPISTSRGRDWQRPVAGAPDPDPVIRTSGGPEGDCPYPLRFMRTW